MFCILGRVFTCRVVCARAHYKHFLDPSPVGLYRFVKRFVEFNFQQTQGVCRGAHMYTYHNLHYTHWLGGKWFKIVRGQMNRFRQQFLEEKKRRKSGVNITTFLL
uniref:Uncharacterized protein n=1 Tax=Cacopsylla melanoneura TaxID=428564 RepID=A0A8D9EMX4_9HEMI